MTLQLVATALLLLVFCTDIESYRIQKREEPPSYLSQVQDLFVTSWDTVSTSTMGLLDKVKEASADIPLIEYYNKGTSAVRTYTDILYDQMYYIWTGL